MKIWFKRLKDDKMGKMNKKTKIFILILISTILLVAGFLHFVLANEQKNKNGQNKSSKQPQVMIRTDPEEEGMIKVQTMKIATGDFEDILNVPGTVEAFEDIEIACENEGIASEVLFKEGDYVKKGDIIIRLDRDILEARIKQAESALTLANDQYERINNLRKQGVASQEDYDVSLANKNSAEQELNVAKVLYSKAVIAAPTSGFLNKIYFDQGEYINKGNTVAHLVNISKVKISAGIPEKDIQKIKLGQSVKITLSPVDNNYISGKIDFLSLKADPQTNTFIAKIYLDNKEMIFRPGMIVGLYMVRNRVSDAIIIPLSSILSKEGQSYVFIEKDGKANMRDIVIGGISGENVLILNGLSVDENLIIVGQRELFDGSNVKVEKTK